MNGSTPKQNNLIFNRYYLEDRGVIRSLLFLLNRMGLNKAHLNKSYEKLYDGVLYTNITNFFGDANE